MSEGHKKAYGTLFPEPDVNHEAWIFRLLSPSPLSQDRQKLTSLLREAQKRYTHVDRGVLSEAFPVDKDIILAFTEYEPALFEEPTLNPHLTFKEEREATAYLKQCIAFHTDIEKSLKAWATTLIALFDTPTIPETPEGMLIAKVPLHSLQSPDTFAQMFFLFFVDEVNFKPLKEKLWRNYCAANGYDVKDVTDKTRLKPVKEIPYDQLFYGTPIIDFLETGVMVTLPDRSRFEHLWCVGPTGGGKSETLKFLFTNHLPNVIEGNASVVVIDSQGDLINAMSRMEYFHDTIPITIIDPMESVENPIALNPFDAKIEGRSLVEREQYYHYLIELLNYVFSELNSDLTSKQALLFNNALRLLLTIPNATIHTLRDMFENKGIEKFRREVDNLPPTIRRFFETEWDNAEYRSTKTQVIRRVYELLSNTTFERMFSNPKSKLDFTKEINTPQVILINTAQELLGQAGCRTFGKFFIALIVQAALQRASSQKRLDTYVYVDEVSQYFGDGSMFETIVTQCRKYRVSLNMFHQHLGQLTPQLQSAFATNTAIKLVGGVSHTDATRLARDMRCETEDITNLDRGQFQLYVRGNKKPTLYRTPFGFLDKYEKMTSEQYHQLKLRMRDKLSTPAIEPPQSTPTIKTDPTEWQ